MGELAGYLVGATSKGKPLAETDLIKLYSTRILSLAAEMPHAGRLEAPMGTAQCRAPLCGSTVTVDLDVTGGMVTRFAQDVKACALGQASAAVLGGAVLGLDRADIVAGRDALARMLKEDGLAPQANFGDLEVLIPAREFANRHASILLAFEATIQAIDAATAAHPA